MYSTVREIHIEIEQRIQQITSARHRSIAPQYYDMCLNRAVIKLIKEKLSNKTNFKREGFEDSLQRVEDFKSLKRTIQLPIYKDSILDRGFTYLPSNCLYVISSNSNVLFDKKNENLKDTDSEILKYYIMNLDRLKTTKTIKEISVRIERDGGDEEDLELPSSLISLLNDEIDKFEFINQFLDYVRDVFKLNIYWETFNDNYNKNCFISNDIRDINLVCTDNTSISSISGSYTINNNIIKNKGTHIYQNDLVSTEIITNILNNFYTSRNRHLNPITEVEQDKLYVYFGNNFVVSDIILNYIKKPRLFISDIDQLSDFQVTDELIDYAVSDLLLQLKDNSFQYVKQLNGQN